MVSSIGGEMSTFAKWFVMLLACALPGTLAHLADFELFFVILSALVGVCIPVLMWGDGYARGKNEATTSAVEVKINEQTQRVV